MQIRGNQWARIRYLVEKVSDDRLFQLSSSVSYYSALSIAPFLLLILTAASLLKTDTQTQIVTFAADSFSPQVGEMFLMIFENTKSAMDIRSFSGILAALFLLFTSSAVFTQLRYSFDVIYGYHDPNLERTPWEYIRDKMFAMLVVLGAAALVILSFSLAAAVDIAFEPEKAKSAKLVVLAINFLVYLTMFTGIHYLTPSRRPRPELAFKIAILTSLFFILGNILLGKYLSNVAAESVYGAAGTLLIFLLWVFYSSFTLFVSVEVFLYLRKIGTIRQRIS